MRAIDYDFVPTLSGMWSICKAFLYAFIRFCMHTVTVTPKNMISPNTQLCKRIHIIHMCILRKFRTRVHTYTVIRSHLTFKTISDKLGARRAPKSLVNYAWTCIFLIRLSVPCALSLCSWLGIVSSAHAHVPYSETWTLQKESGESIVLVSWVLDLSYQLNKTFPKCSNTSFTCIFLYQMRRRDFCITMGSWRVKPKIFINELIISMFSRLHYFSHSCRMLSAGLHNTLTLKTRTTILVKLRTRICLFFCHQ